MQQTRRAGTMPSLAMAWRRRGAPVKLCSPAPQVEKKEPITITHGDGQANVPITKFPWTPSPNLKGTRKGGRWKVDLQRYWNPLFPPKISSSCPEMLISSSGTYLSLSTTPSMQAPNRKTLDMSEQPGIRTATASQRNVSGCQNSGQVLF